MGSSGATVSRWTREPPAFRGKLLDNHTPGSGDDRPWAIRTKLLRKLRTTDFRSAVNDASADDSVLVIGDPACDRSTYPKLFGARQEATAVAAWLRDPQAGAGTMAREAGPSVTTLISALIQAGIEPDARHGHRTR